MLRTFVHQGLKITLNHCAAPAMTAHLGLSYRSLYTLSGKLCAAVASFFFFFLRAHARARQVWRGVVFFSFFFSGDIKLGLHAPEGRMSATRCDRKRSFKRGGGASLLCFNWKHGLHTMSVSDFFGGADEDSRPATDASKDRRWIVP